MHKLIILRHGTTEDPSPDIPDHERELMQEGIEEAKRVGNKLATHDIDSIVSSSAIRTGQTAFTVAEAINYPAENINLIDELYNPSVTQILDVIQNLPETDETVMLVGHNPGFTEICNEICNRYDVSLSTCNYCIIEISTSWNNVGKDTGRLLLKDTP